MAQKKIKAPIMTGLLEEISKICVATGLTRRTFIEDNSLRGFAEAGIGAFEIIIEEKKKEDFLLTIKARNDQAIFIISNVVETAITDLTKEHKKAEEEVKKLEYKCATCKEDLKFLNKKSLFGDLKVDVMTCPKCLRVQFFQENKENQEN